MATPMDPKLSTPTKTATTEAAAATAEAPKIDDAGDKEAPPGRKIAIFIAIVHLIFICVAGGFIFTIIFNQSKINDDAKKVLETHKEAAIDFVDKAVSVVEDFPIHLNEFPMENLTDKMFTLIRDELKTSDLKNLTIIEEGESSAIQNVYTRINDKCPPLPSISTGNDFRILVNNGINAQNAQLMKINKPINAYQSTFAHMLKEQSEKPGVLSEKNLVGYSGNIIISLNEYKIGTVARDEALMKSFETQVASQNVAHLAHSLVTVILYAIALLMFVANTTFTTLYHKQKISLEKLKRYLKIIMIVSSIFALGMLIVSILDSTGLSMFAYECELKSDSPVSKKKFTNFDGKVANLGALIDGCEKGETVYSKLSPYLNEENIKSNLDGYEKEVTKFASTIKFKNEVVYREISNEIAPLIEQRDELRQYEGNKNCFGPFVMPTFNMMIRDLENTALELEKLEKGSTYIADTKLQPIIANFTKTSFDTLRRVSKTAVNSINAQLKTSDVGCHVDLPTGLCELRADFLQDATIVSWILVVVFLLNGLMSMLLYALPGFQLRRKLRIANHHDVL